MERRDETVFWLKNLAPEIRSSAAAPNEHLQRLFPPSHVRNKKREAWQALKRRSSSYRSDREKKNEENLSSGMQMLAFEPKYLFPFFETIEPQKNETLFQFYDVNDGWNMVKVYFDKQ